MNESVLEFVYEKKANQTRLCDVNNDVECE